MQGLLYIGCVYAGNTVGFTAWLLTKLAVGSTASTKGVADCAGPLQAVLVVPVV